MSIERIIANNVFNLRKAKKMSQEELAGESDMSSQYFGKIERAEVSVKIDKLENLAKALDTTITYLITDNN